jgi:hypothetical protein
MIIPDFETPLWPPRKNLTVILAAHTRESTLIGFHAPDRLFGGSIVWLKTFPQPYPSQPRQNGSGLGKSLHMLSQYPWLRAQLTGVPKHSYGPGHRFPGYSGTHEYRKKHGHDPPTPRPEWLTFMASCVQNKAFRHVACCVADNTSHKEHPGEPLRSEIVPAIHFIRKQMELTKDISHAIPVWTYPRKPVSPG